MAFIILLVILVCVNHVALYASPKIYQKSSRLPCGTLRFKELRKTYFFRGHSKLQHKSSAWGQQILHANSSNADSFNHNTATEYLRDDYISKTNDRNNRIKRRISKKRPINQLSFLEQLKHLNMLDTHEQASQLSLNLSSSSHKPLLVIPTHTSAKGLSRNFLTDNKRYNQLLGTPERGVGVLKQVFPRPLQGLSKNSRDKDEKFHNSKRVTRINRLKRSIPHRSFHTLGDHNAIKCPHPCRCHHSIDGTTFLVNCSNMGLSEIPALPVAATEVTLRNNTIKGISCTAFKNMKTLRRLHLSMNTIGVLKKCSFSDLASLEHLSLSANQLSILPSRVFKPLQRLVELDLGGNQITNLDPGLFSGLGKLSWLTLFDNRLTKISNHTFQGLKSLVFLSLQGNILRYVPETFENGAFLGLTSLESLHLEGNQPDFPENFNYPDQALSNIPSLQNLWLDGYPRSLGPGFSRLVNLSHLSFAGGDGSYCSMGSTIPSQFFSHITTKQPLYLNMSACSFQSIPPELFRAVRNIYSLDLSNNNHISIDGFEKGSKGLENSSLTVLNLTNFGNFWNHNRKIRNTTFQYLKHTQLQILIMEYSKITEISPHAVTDLPYSLRFLSFKGNKVTTAEALLTCIRFLNLTVINLSNQVFYPLPKELTFHRPKDTSQEIGNMGKKIIPQDAFLYNKTNGKELHTNWRKLVTANLNARQSFNLPDISNSESQFCPHPFGFADTSMDSIIIPLSINLKRAYASNIKVGYNIPKLHFVNNQVLEFIDYSANAVRCAGGPISGLPSLKYFDFSRNWCYRLNSIFFIHLRSIKTLLLYKNMLGDALSKANGIKPFSFLVDLEVLDLSNNVIKDLPEFLFSENVNLKHLDLSHNALTQFQVSLESNTKLERLDLSYNLFTGLSESTCRQLQDIKRASPNFTVSLIEGDDRFLCDCDNLFFLNFLLQNPKVFEDVEKFECRLSNGSRSSYKHLVRIVPQLAFQCLLPPIFTGVLVAFFLVVGSVSGCALYYYKRWQWRYLYYMGKSRLHLDSMYLTYRPLAHAYVTYDQENRRLRSMMKNVFRPRLHELGITTVLGEVDFGAGLKEPSIAGAVTSTGKTLVFLSADIFKDYYRQFEVNLAIMHELHLRKPVLVPVLLLREEDLNCVRSPLSSLNCSTSSSVEAGLDEEEEEQQQQQKQQRRRQEQQERRQEQQIRNHNTAPARRPQPIATCRSRCVAEVDDYTRFQKLIRGFPPEISMVLKGQQHRCLVYPGDTDMFWNHLKTIILEDQ